MRFIKFVLIICLLVTVSACSFNNRKVNNSFYYWQSTFDMNTQEIKKLNKLNITNLYIKFFDVVWDNQINSPKPVSSIFFKDQIPNKVTVIPTIYITNQTLRKLSQDQVSLLAENIYKKINNILNKNNLNKPPEIQLDCDWTETTKTKYFKLLQFIDEKLEANTRLSATIRLHQVKYIERTGVPPVDRGALMFYNLNHPGKLDVKNSVLDLEVGKQYLNKLSSYPLELDIALPIYSWGVLFQEDNYMGLIKNLTEEQLSNNSAFSKVKENTYLAEQNSYVQGTYVYKNDRIRVDESEYTELLNTAKYISKRLSTHKTNIMLFHLDENLLRRFEDEQLQKVFSTFN
ncbi:hypothetical protein [Sporohalobacter salinus]|uniref:hypothetical protein n=1 Tax=Sporohalobacter salinus TaxID=1494606 RepID=UPI001960E6B0|nr:hypothetical protein [Sporohalobacter salinus]MBM7623777.1 hypothetical protein [Sporohalobacter salinus]